MADFRAVMTGLTTGVRRFTIVTGSLIFNSPSHEQNDMRIATFATVADDSRTMLSIGFA